MKNLVHLRTRGLSGKTRIILAAGAVAAVLAVTTGASSVDQASMNLGGGTGIGFAHRFDIALVHDGLVEQADSDGGVDWAIEGAESLVPGKSISTVIPVFNNTESLRSAVNFSLALRNGDGSVSETVPNILPFLRFSAIDGEGEPLFSNVPWDKASASLGVLAARSTTALNQGDSYVAGAASSDGEVKLTISYLDLPGVEKLNGGQASIAVHFDATSVKP